MSKVWLVLDVSNLAHRALHTTGSLSHKGAGTGVLFGVLRDVLSYQRLFDPAGFVFCFDSETSLRRQSHPFYKASRGVPDDDFLLQVAELEFILNKIGFRNLLRWDGYEADDLIASAAQSVLGTPDDKAVIVSSDQDLYQLLRVGRVWMYKPREKLAYTEDHFRTEYSGIDPRDWVDVKAIAGCPGDEVPGAKGVGVKTAVRFLTGRLGEKLKAYWNIEHFNWRSNIPLVKLPYLGCPPCFLRSDEASPDAWRDILKRLGMKSLIRQYFRE